MKPYYQLSGEEVLREVNGSEEPLTKEQVSENQKKYGPNELTEGKKKTTVQIFLEQYKDFLVIILIIAAIASGFMGDIESAAVIVIVITMNAILGTVQTVKAEASLASLKKLSGPEAKVLRDGVVVPIPSAEVTVGDIIMLEAGDYIPADGRILECASMKVDESALTGESLGVEKTTDVIEQDEVPLGDRINMVYSGSLVASGRAVVLVTGTGMNTELGKIADLMNLTQEKKTPLQISLDNFSKKLAALIIVICIVVFLLSLYRDMTVLDSLLFAVALAVAAIPEALGSIVTIVQAMGTQKMAKEHAIIKELKAVESLGCVSVICSDKTGTLTQNKMTVQQIYMNNQCIEVPELDMKSDVCRYLVDNAVLNNDSSISEGKGIGDPTEFCLLEMVQKAGIDYHEIRNSMKRLEEIAFDSDRKLMSSRYRLDGRDVVFTKGALDVLLDRSVSIAEADGDGKLTVRPITQKDKDNITAQNQAFSENGLRVLSFAFREIQPTETLNLEFEKDFVFLGLISMIDPPREESKAAVADAKRAGIKPIMITGDHKVTATAIARQIGIFEDGDLAVTGAQLDAMPEEELDEKLEKISVYARVSPENKIRIVDAWQKKGKIAAMTGDGVNDAPALKKADIGVAMGITGTEVSKDAASMILTDDNFATIIKAVSNGRNVYRNIKNAIQFLLSGNTAGIFAVLYTSLLGLPVPFAPVHLLFINLLTDSLPALAIGMEPPERDILSQKPRDPKTGILTKDFLIKLLYQGGLIAVCTIIAFYIGLQENAKTASTMAFAVLTMARLFHGFNCRSEHSIFKIGMKRNWWSLGAFLLGMVLIHLVLLIPVLKGLFEVMPLNGMEFGMIYLLAFIPTVVIQCIKVIKEHRKEF